jgi:PAS domain S-box-containing protein
MLLLCVLIATNGVLSYNHLERLLADVRRADQANADLAACGDLLREAAELKATTVAYAISGDAELRRQTQDVCEQLTSQTQELSQRLAADGRATAPQLASLGQSTQELVRSATALLAMRDLESVPLPLESSAPVEVAMRALRAEVGALQDQERSNSESWLQQSTHSQHSARVSLINATAGALILLAAVFVLVRRDLRERLIAERRRRHEEARYRRLVDSDVMGVLITKIDGQVTEANDTFLKLIGYRREDLAAGRVNWRSLTPASCDQADQSALEQLAKEGVAQPYEKLFLHASGDPVPVLLGCARVDPAREDMICYAIDLSQPKAAEALIKRLNRELQERLHELETLFELAPIGLALAKDRDCKNIAVNGQLARQLGLPSSANASLTAALQERPTNYKMIFDGKEVPPESLPMQQAAALGTSICNQEFDLVLSDGTTTKMLANVAPLFDEQGASRGSIGVFLDITERKRLENNLQAHADHLQHQQQWSQALLDLLPVPLLLIEPITAKVTFANRAAHEAAGGRMPLNVPLERYSEAYHCTDLQGQDLSNEEIPGARVARGERLNDVEINWEVAGVARSLLINADTLAPTHGHDAVAVLMFSDISHLKEIESELVRINQAKDALLTMLGHELRNPLAAIAGATELIAVNSPDAKIYHQSMDILTRQTQHLSRLIDDLIDLSRLTAGKVRLRVETVDLARSLRGAVQATEGLIRDRGHQLSVTAPDDELFIEGDPARLEQIIANLLQNAAKFTEPGGKIQLSAAIEQKNVVVRIRDTGVGLDPVVVPKLFELFAQISPKLDRTDTGLGIGLTVVRNLVSLHGGRVHASSAGPGCGSEFVVELPLSAARPNQPRQTTPGVSTTKPLNVLVVEDQPDIGQVMQALLERYGHHPHWAPSAVDALDLAAKRVPDLAFIDIGLPVTNGYDLAKQLRADPRFRRTMLVALTGFGQQDDRDRSKAAGFTHHLVKPIDSETLLKMLAECADRMSTFSQRSALSTD